MRVCHLGKYYPPAPGGIETHLQTLARAQVQMGLTASVLCLNHSDSPATREDDRGVSVQRFNSSASAFHLPISLPLLTAIRNIDADILHMQVPNPAMILHVLAARPKQTMVVTYQSDIVRQRVRATLFRPFERRFYKRVTLIMPTSQAYAEGSEFLAPYAAKLTTLPMGIDLDPYLNPSAEHLRLAKEITQRISGPIWLGCGRLVYYKGFINAIRAIKCVPGTLVIVGSGPELNDLTREAEKQGVQDRVQFVGNLSYLDIIPYYLAAKALWFPSNARSEAFGLVQVEAMACGCPVINTAIPGSGVSWVSLDGVTGLTIPMDDPAALAAAARRLLNEPGLHARLARAARERATMEFDQRVMVRRCVEIYEKALK